jgi:hypothetical protein
MADVIQRRLKDRKKIAGTSTYVLAFDPEEVDQNRVGVNIKVKGPGVAEIHDNDALDSGDLPWLELTDGQLKFYGFSPEDEIWVRGAGMTIQIEQVRTQTV